jgi:predicted CopG family antitoxin
MELFAKLTDSDVEKFVRTINKLPAGADGVRPLIPYASIRKLQAIRHWAIEQKRLNLEVVHNAFTAEEQGRMMDRIDEEDQVEAVTVSPPAFLPDKFTSFTKWRTFSEGFKGHCAVLRGCMKIPIVYVLRDHEVVTDEMMEAEYTTTDK